MAEGDPFSCAVQGNRVPRQASTRVRGLGQPRSGHAQAEHEGLHIQQRAVFEQEGLAQQVLCHGSWNHDEVNLMPGIADEDAGSCNSLPAFSGAIGKHVDHEWSLQLQEFAMLEQMALVSHKSSMGHSAEGGACVNVALTLAGLEGAGSGGD